MVVAVDHRSPFGPPPPRTAVAAPPSPGPSNRISLRSAVLSPGEYVTAAATVAPAAGSTVNGTLSCTVWRPRSPPRTGFRRRSYRLARRQPVRRRKSPAARRRAAATVPPAKLAACRPALPETGDRSSGRSRLPSSSGSPQFEIGVPPAARRQPGERPASCLVFPVGHFELLSDRQFHRRNPVRRRDRRNLSIRLSSAV